MKILSFNIWGAPYAKEHSARIAALAEKVKELNPDILCFQEVYMPDNRADLIERLKAEWPYYHYFASALIGSGLLTMSRYPITEAVFHRFRMGGKPEDIKRGDYYAGKGIGLTRVALPDRLVDIYNIHPHAQYEFDDDNEYAVYTESNLFEAVGFVNAHSGENPLVLCGDMNTRPEQAGYRILMGLGNFVDAYVHQHGQAEITYSAANPYASAADQCLDYIFLRGLGVSQIELVLNENLAGKAKAYSDHYGLLAEINFHDVPKAKDMDIRPILAALDERVKIALAETEGAQLEDIGQVILAISSMFDVALVLGFVGRWNKKLGNRLRFIVWIGAIFYAFYHLIQASLNMQARKQTLESLEQEIRLMRETLSELQS